MQHVKIQALLNAADNFLQQADLDDLVTLA